MSILRQIAAIFILAAASAASQAEEIIFDKQVSLCQPLSIKIESAQIPETMKKDGVLTLFVTAENKTAGWTLHCNPESMYLSDGKNRSPLLDRKGEHLGAIPSGTVRKLRFALPSGWNGTSLTLELTKGLYSMIAKPEGPHRLEIWLGVRPKFEIFVDKANRNAHIDCSSLGGEGVKFLYETSDGRRLETPADTARFRFAETPVPFTVKITATTRSGETLAGSVEAVPHQTILAPPFPVEQVLTGPCAYNLEDVEPLIDAGLGNLLVLWNEPSSIDAKKPFLRKMREKGLSYLSIYRSGLENAATISVYRDLLGGRYFQNNIGEFAGYIYQTINEAKACNRPVNLNDMRLARDSFINEFVAPKVRAEHRVFDYILSTSGATLADYELAGGMDFMSGELYAVGANNLNFATAEMRGAARKWKPEFWGGWLAEEWQTFNVPYSSQQKYDLLKIGLYGQYLMGTSIIVLESGASTTQAHNYTAEAEKQKQLFDGHAPRNYRRVMREFGEFVKANPRDRGTPETKIALLRGNLDGWIGAFHDWIPAWAQHETAQTKKHWLTGLPERAWLSVMNVFTPIVPSALKPYDNYWAGGMPFGQVDVVGLAEDSRLSDLKRYDFAVLGGWNTMEPAVAEVLSAYVENGGTLVLTVPQCSTRRDRDYVGYTAKDLLGGGKLQPLLDVEISAFAPLSGSVDGVELKQEPVAVARLGRNVETLSSVDGRPLIVAERRGKGRVILLLGYNYPGEGAYAELFRDFLRRQADGVAQSVKIASLSENKRDIDAISFACYAEKVYFLNTDCVSGRKFQATIDGVSRVIELGPAEFRTVGRK